MLHTLHSLDDVRHQYQWFARMRATEPVWFWANLGGRAALAALLFGISVACVAKANSANAEE